MFLYPKSFILEFFDTLRPLFDLKFVLNLRKMAKIGLKTKVPYFFENKPGLIFFFGTFWWCLFSGGAYFRVGLFSFSEIFLGRNN